MNMYQYHIDQNCGFVLTGSIGTWARVKIEMPHGYDLGRY
jgi:hypothetical protein